MLAKNKVTTLEHPPYSWPSSSRFLTPASTEISIEWTVLLWCYHEECDERAEKVLIKWLSGMFPTLYIRWQKCIVSQWDYFEGNVAWIILLFCNITCLITLQHSVGELKWNILLFTGGVNRKRQQNCFIRKWVWKLGDSTVTNTEISVWQMSAFSLDAFISVCLLRSVF